MKPRRAPMVRARRIEAIGNVTNDPDLVVEGAGDEAAGKTQDAIGHARRKLGEAVEKVGSALKK